MTTNELQSVPDQSSAFAFDLDGGEKLLPVTEIPVYIGKLTGHRPHVNQARRWLQVGTAGIPLPSLLIGGSRYTSAAAIRWWITATTAASRMARTPR